MDATAAKAVVERELATLCDRLGVSHWSITVEYDNALRSAQGQQLEGQCTWRIEYENAVVELRPDAYPDEKALLKTLRHELFHVILSPFSLVDNIVGHVLESDPVKAAMVREAWVFATEQAVINLERMYRGLTTPEPSSAPQA